MTPAEFVQNCRACVAARGAATEIAALVRPALVAQSQDSTWWDVGEFMYRSEDLLIVNLTLPPSFATPIHNHGMWAVVGISSGCEVDRYYVRAGAQLEAGGEVTVCAGRAIELGADVIHTLSNPLRTVVRGIHVYGGDMVRAPRSMWHPTTGVELDYDARTFDEWCEALTRAASTKSAASQASTRWDL